MIYFDSEFQAFYLESKGVTYAFRVTEYGFLQHLYFGDRIDRKDLRYTYATICRGHAT